MTHLHTVTKNDFRLFDGILFKTMIAGAELPVSTQKILICPSEMYQGYPKIDR